MRRAAVGSTWTGSPRRARLASALAHVGPWHGRLLGVLAMLAVACAKPGPVDDASDLADPTAVIERVAPQVVLEEGAAALDASVRAAALAHLVATEPAPGGGAWAARGLYDPDPWVQRQVGLALAERLPESASGAVLDAFLARDGVEPYVRGAVAVRAASGLSDATKAALAGAWRAEPSSWRRGPLALAAALTGDADAVPALAEVLRHAEVDLDVGFVLDVGRSGLGDLRPALAEGQELVEEELAVAWASARAALGDAAAIDALRAALNGDDPLAALEAIDHLAALGTPAAVELLAKARGAEDPFVRDVAALAFAAHAGNADRLERAMASPDPELRRAAVRRVGDALRRDPRARTERLARRVVRLGLVDADLTVRVESLRAAPLVADRTLVDPVAAALTDESVAVRVEAAGASMRLAMRLGS